MNIYIPKPGSSMFDDYVKRIARTSGVDSMSVRVTLITLVQQAETNDRERRESDAREARGEIDI